MRLAISPEQPLYRMSIVFWCLLYALNCLFCKWVVSWGGAEKIEGWKSIFLVSTYAARWEAEAIKLYMLVVWLLTTFGFVAGLFLPDFRTFYL